MDKIEFINYTNQAKKIYSNYGRNDEFKQIEFLIISTRNPKYCYNFARSVEGADVQKLGEVVIKYGNPELNLQFANIAGADTIKHRETIIQSKDVKANIEASIKIKDEHYLAYVERHGEIVLSYGNMYNIYQYLKYNYKRGLKTERYFNKIEQEGGNYFNTKVAKEIKNADVKRHGKVVIDSKDGVANCVFAQIEGADTFKHEQIVLDLKDESLSLMFVKSVKNCNIQAHKEIIMNGDNVEIKQEFIDWLTTNNKNNYTEFGR